MQPSATWMLRFRNRRILPALFASPAVLVLALTHANAQRIWVDHYQSALQAQATSVLFLLVPAVAALVAWEVGRLNNADVLTLPAVRSQTERLVRAMTAPLILVMTSLASAVILLAGLAPPQWRIILPAIATLVAAALLGAAAGVTLPKALGAPISLAVGYLFMVLPQALTPFWLRHLNGMFMGCCLTSQSLNPRASVASMLTALGVGVAGAIVASRRVTRVEIVVSILIATIGISSAALIVRHLGPDPVVARKTDLICDSLDGVQFCLWPENRKNLDLVARTGSAIVSAWIAAGLHPPMLYSEATNSTRSTFSIRSSATSENVAHAMVAATLPPVPLCAASYPYPGGADRDQLQAWLLMTSRFVPTPAIGSRVEQRVMKVLREPRSQQVSWLLARLQASQICDALPRKIAT